MSALQSASQRAALTLSAAMLEAARAGDWSQLEALDRQRQPLLRTGHPGGVETADWLREVLAYNQQISALVAAAHAAAGEALGAHGRAHRALAAYVALAS